MSGAAAVENMGARQPDEARAPLSSPRPSVLLAAAAERHGRGIAFRDQANREAWSGRPPLEWTYSVADKIVGRLAAFFARLGLTPGSAVGLCLPNGSEAWLSLLAVERAGLTPCLLPIGWPPGRLAEAVEGANVQAVVTQGVFAEDQPAELFCRLAAQYFSLRFVCAFGPRVPDGVIDLDRVILIGDAAVHPGQDPEELGASDPGRVTFSVRRGVPDPVYRPAESIAAAALDFLMEARIEPGDRIVTLLNPDTHAGLTTGLAAALVSGATLEAHGLFDAAALRDSIEGDGPPTHLVAPGWSETALSESGLPDRLASVILVYRAPIRFKARTLLRGRVLDVLAIDELALISRRRGAAGAFAMSLQPSDGSLLQIKQNEDGSIVFAGPAADIRPFGRYGPAPPNDGSVWTPSGFKADLFAGIVIGIS
jgi:mycobactin salicyl-AMP ligase